MGSGIHWNAQFLSTRSWVFLCRALSQVVLQRVRRRRGPRRHAELVEDVADVARDGLLADEELRADLAVRLARGQERQELDLALRQARRPFPSRPGQKSFRALPVRLGSQAAEGVACSLDLHPRGVVIAQCVAGLSE